MKRSPMPPRTKPMRRTPLTTGGARRRTMLQPAVWALPAELRMALQARAGGFCEACGERMPGWFDAHHRKLRSRGGLDTLDNLMAVTRECHEWLHQHPTRAGEMGMMVSAWDDPHAVSMLRYGLVITRLAERPTRPAEGRVFLTFSGGVL